MWWFFIGKIPLVAIMAMYTVHRGIHTEYGFGLALSLLALLASYWAVYACYEHKDQHDVEVRKFMFVHNIS